MWRSEPRPICYVLKRWPRLSETFIASEVLAHEAAGVPVEIVVLYPPVEAVPPGPWDRVKAPVRYLVGPPDVEGAQLLSQAIARALPAIPAVATLARDEPGTRPRELAQAIWLAQLARERRYRHLHAHFATVATTVARVAARLAGLRYSFTAHAKDIYHESVDHVDLARKLGQASCTVTVSAYNLGWLQSRFGHAADRAVHIYNGVDLTEYPFHQDQDREPVILYAGRLVPKKGVADLLRACRLLRQAGRPFRCDIVGGGQLEVMLRAEAAALGLDPVVRFLGPRSREEVARLMQRARVVAAPCVVSDDGDRDGLPTVLLEAMALGTPCVSTEITGIPELIEDQSSGLLTPPRDPVALAAALGRLLDDPMLRVRLARGARVRVERDFDIARNTTRLRRLFAAPSPALVQEVG